MSVKLFLLGSPGSGKSTVAQYIESLARDEGWSFHRMNDYAILREMFEMDQRRGEGRFKPARYGGFDVLDFTAFDEALRELEQRAALQIAEGSERTIVLIEFARNDYWQAFLQFSPEFLRDVYVLYLDVDIEVCKQRIRSRIAEPKTADDYYVSEYIFQAYYEHDNGQRLRNILAEYDVENRRVKILENNGGLELVAPEIASFIRSIVCIPTHDLIASPNS